MSVKQMAKVWSLDLPHNQLWVLMALADYADDDGYCWPSAPKLAHKTGYSERQIRRLMEGLRDRGIITQKQRDGRSSETWLHLNKAPAKKAFTPDKMTGGKQDQTPDIAMSPHPGQNVTPTPDILSETPDIAMSPITISNQSIEPVKETSIAKAEKKPRPRNVIWDAVAAVCGDPAMEDEESDFGRTVSQLKKADSNPDEIAQFALWWDQTFPGAKLTHRCYRLHLGKFRNAPPPRPPSIDDIKDPAIRALFRMRENGGYPTTDIREQTHGTVDDASTPYNVGGGKRAHGNNIRSITRGRG